VIRCAWLLGVGLMLGLPSSAASNPTKSPQLSLEEGRVAYERGQYGEAVLTIHPLLYPQVELRSEESVVEAHRLLALSYLFLTKTGEAEQEGASLLALRPDYEPDPVLDPPAAVAFFHSLKKKQDDRLREIRERERQEERAREEAKKREQQKAKAEQVWVERVVEKHHRIIGFIPFGAGQFQNHQVGYGVGFAVAETLLAGTWIGLTVAINERYPSSAVPKADRELANTLLGLQVGSAAAFWAVVAWGIIDAQVKFVPEHVVQTRQRHGQPPTSEKRKNKLTLAPLISPSLFGLGVQGVW
jgi:hypothetical protein